MMQEENVFKRTIETLKSPVGGWTHKLALKCGISALVGAVVGMITALTVNISLVEIALSPLFAMGFGVGFFIIGFMIACRIRQAQLPIDKGSFAGRRQILSTFVAISFISGILCFFTRVSILHHVPWIFKMPIFTILGVGLAFAFCFSIVDLINTLSGFMRSTYSVPVIEDSKQVAMVVISSSLMGGLFGMIFGWMDMEDTLNYQVQLALMRETHICYPVGFLIGGSVGFMNEYFRNEEIALNVQGRHTLYDEEL